MKPVIFENIRTREQLICDDLRNVSVIDGEEYLAVRKPEQARIFLVRRSVLTQIKSKKKKQ